MIGLDTNVLARAIVSDVPEQATLARALLQSLAPDRPGLVTTVTLAELYLVLRRGYQYEKAQIHTVFCALIRQKHLHIQDLEIVVRAIDRFQASGFKADIPDCLIACTAEVYGASATYTFDQAASKHAGMRLLSEIG